MKGFLLEVFDSLGGAKYFIMARRSRVKSKLTSALALAHPTIMEHARSYQKKKAEKALLKAKRNDEEKLNSGKKWVLLPDGKTKALR